MFYMFKYQSIITEANLKGTVAKTVFNSKDQRLRVENGHEKLKQS